MQEEALGCEQNHLLQCESPLPSGGVEQYLADTCPGGVLEQLTRMGLRILGD